MTIERRKADHIRINLDEDVGFDRLTVGFEQYRFIHQALPELDLKTVSLTTRLFHKSLQAPVLISSMTGGTEQARQINLNLAQAAQHYGVAMGLGSQRAGIQHPEVADTFKVRSVAPDILLFANLGAVQFNYGYDVEHCIEAVQMIEADALILHLNPLQEAVQPEGDINFSGLIRKIEAVCKRLPVPVIAKEVGWGISEQAAKMLADAGVAAIDVAGSGGTSWSQVELFRAPDDLHRRVAAAFRDWGIPTAESVQMVKRAAPNLPIIASGGIRSGIDIAKAIALGATLGGMAGPFLKAATISAEAVMETLEETVRVLRIAMFSAGASSIEALQKTPLIRER
ncbi:MAG: type 2 isopentenyl-diphosphate Delta-isomerase [Thermoflexales bacterium]|nr:type 2 isopentenyl-diphosphate Delta-isomerase [Thermoflexales bacterium]